MTGTKLAALATSGLLCAMLAGCGGGDSGGVASTPVPPPAGTNSSLIGPLKSESFFNDATQGSLSVSGNANTVAANAAKATFVYQANTQTYTIAVGSQSRNFAPADIDTNLTNSEIAVYVIKSGNTTDSLTLTKPGTSGRFTYQYVGAAFWQNSTINTSSGNGSLNALTYGEPTPTAAVPLSGQGQYGIDMLGATATGSTVQGISGQGALMVDFATDALVLGGSVMLGGTPVGSFGGAGKLTSSGSFSGAFNLSQFGSGQMAGRLYGPAAQEVGASFYASNGTGAAATVTAGAFLGRSQVSTANSDFSTFSGAQFFGGDRARQIFSGSGTDGLGRIEIGLTGPNIAAANGGIFAPDYTTSAFFTANSVTDLSQSAITMNYVLLYNQDNPAGVYVLNPVAPGTQTTPFNTQYARAAVYDNTSGKSQFFDYFTFGFDTPISTIPTSGFSGYQINIDGTMTNAKAAAPTSEITGTGAIGINFVTNKITTNGAFYNAGAGNSPLGAFSGTGTLASSSNGFSSSLLVTGGATTYNGNIQGSLYGPAANEVGAVFNANGADGTDIAGVITGPQNAALTDPAITLATLGGATNFSTSESGYAHVAATSPSDRTGSGAGITQIAYDPGSKTYVLTSSGSVSNPAYLTPVTATLSPNNIDNTNSNAAFTAYSAPNINARILNPGVGNPVIQLSYVSFAEVIATSPNSVAGTTYPVYHFAVFGLQTNFAMPKFGTATYSGAVFGRGNYTPISDGVVSLGGSTGQMNVDFGAGTMTTTLSLTGTPPAGGLAQNIGSYSFSGPITGSNFTGNTSFAGGSGSLNGAFFGPIANEVGAAFNLNLYSNNGSAIGIGNLAGVFVGKKH